MAETTGDLTAALQSLTADLSAALTPDEVLDVLADAGRPIVQAESINISLLDDTGLNLRLVASRRSSPQVRIQFATYPVDGAYPTRDVLATLQPVRISSRRERDERYPALVDVEVDQVAWAIYPLLAERRPLGVVGLGWATPQPFDRDQLDACEQVADLAAAALARAQRFDAEQQARAAAEDLAQRLNVLQTLTAALAEATDLATVGELVVGAGLRALSADAATIGLFDGDHTFTALSSVGVPDDLLPRWSTHDITGSPLARDVLTSRRAVVVTSAADREARYPDPARTDDSFPASATLPLLTASTPIGIVAYGWSRPRTFDQHDLEYLTAIAAHAATAIDRSQLLARTEQVAETLQRALLPAVVTELPGWDLATCYTPAVEGTQVGGDWYDVFGTPDGRIVLVIGDVAGKGVRAAAVMGAVRSAARAYATVEPTPQAILRRLDDYFATFKSGEMVTCAIAVLDPRTGQVTYASAGHLPPLVVGDGATRWLDDATTQPLGALAEPSREQATTTIDPGDVLLLYTDGLVERRDQDIDHALHNLAGISPALRTAPDLERATTDLIPQLDAPNRVVDDVAILALRRLHHSGPARTPASDSATVSATDSGSATLSATTASDVS